MVVWFGLVWFGLVLVVHPVFRPLPGLGLGLSLVSSPAEAGLGGASLVSSPAGADLLSLSCQ
ncbi:hypothetical protein V4886_25185, partial [Ralstonia solanacearum species complex bacterium RW470]|uniref:hypothetical protein n=1 Tax=Ralstonia solanacearum species complex bacterium RW470 TaxID=3119580 RepID=UPI002FC3906A